MNSTQRRPRRGGFSSSGRRKTFSSTPRHKRGGSNRSSRPFSGSRPQGSRSHSGGFRGRSQRGGGRKMPSFNPAQFINTNPTDVKEEAYTPQNTFNTFGLNDALVKTIHDMGITTPTPIQDQIIPHILEGRDVIGLAETGTGKTAAFLAPLIEQALKNDSRQVLILTPTRELALQIQSELQKLSKGFRLFSTICVGGTNIYPQIKGLGRKNHFIIGTPGRIIDLMKRRAFNPERIGTVVLDEADRMLDMGFINDIRTIMSKVPEKRETLFFSATMAKEAERLVNDFLKNPITVSVKKKDVTNSIEQDVVPFEHRHKFDTLTGLFENNELKRVIIFGSMKHSVQKLAEELTGHGIKAESIHGNKSHSARQRSLNSFKSGNARVLVATDVAARGIHVDGVSHVINYDLPQTFDDYVHRIGRTGRGIHKGKALTFVQK